MCPRRGGLREYTGRHRRSAPDQLGGLVAAWDDGARSFLLYHVMIGLQPEAAAQSLLAIAAAAEAWTQKKPKPPSLAHASHDAGSTA